MYIMCVCLFSALGRRVGALQISVIITINTRRKKCPQNVAVSVFSGIACALLATSSATPSAQLWRITSASRTLSKLTTKMDPPMTSPRQTCQICDFRRVVQEGSRSETFRSEVTGNLPEVKGIWRVHYVKGQVQGWEWFLTRFPLKFTENNDTDEIVIWVL